MVNSTCSICKLYCVCKQRLVIIDWFGLNQLNTFVNLLERMAIRRRYVVCFCVYLHEIFNISVRECISITSLWENIRVALIGANSQLILIEDTFLQRLCVNKVRDEECINQTALKVTLMIYVYVRGSMQCFILRNHINNTITINSSLWWSTRFSATRCIDVFMWTVSSQSCSHVITYQWLCGSTWSLDLRVVLIFGQIPTGDAVQELTSAGLLIVVDQTVWNVSLVGSWYTNGPKRVCDQKHAKYSTGCNLVGTNIYTGCRGFKMCWQWESGRWRERICFPGVNLQL